MERTFFNVFSGCLAFLLAGGGILFLAWLLWWLWSRQRQEDQVPAAEIELDAAAASRTSDVGARLEEQVLPLVEIEGPGGPDDLRVIEGIGPRIAAVLQAGGIRTFRDLAGADVAQLEEILRAADPRLLHLCKPDTWPEQAALAAAGNWKGLEALTDLLKGGRRV